MSESVASASQPVVSADANPSNSAQEKKPEGEQKLSNAELKKRQKAEKQAKRAAKKEAEAVVAPPTASSGPPPSGPPPGNTPKPAAQNQQHQTQKPKVLRFREGRGPAEPHHRGLEYFKNLCVKDHSEFDTPDNINERVMYFVEQMLNNEFHGSTARCSAMIESFKSVISDYEIPKDNTLSRHFIPECLSKQVEYIKSFRPLSIGMANIIKHLEAAVVRVNPSLSGEEAKKQLIAILDDYFIHRIQTPETIIKKRAASHIQDGDTILTFANSGLVSKIIVEAHQSGKRFKTIVVDSAPLYEGRTLSTSLTEAGLISEYYTITNIAHAMKEATKVIIGTQGILNDGRLYSRSGTAVVAIHAKAQGVPFIVCCQSFKFSDNALVDAFAENELSPLEDFLDDEDLQAKWNGKVKELQLLRFVNPLYDLTPSDYVSVVACEFGCIGPSSVPEVYALVDESQNQVEV